MAGSPPPEAQIGPAGASRLLEALRTPDAAPAAGAGSFPGVPGYVTLESLGEGASGAVYKVVRAGAEHPLALKLMRVRLGEDAASKRAWRELHVLESLRLPAIPHLHDFGELQGRLYVITDLIEGEHPDALADARSLDRHARVRLLADVADAVHTLHEQGVIHRDLNPSNILITPAGRVVVLDLGLAVLVAKNVVDTLTEDGQAVGTPAFMAPEQARGERAAVGTRADVYSLGAIGFLLLTGSTPHDTNTSIHEAIRRVGSDEPRNPRSLNPALPRALSAVLTKAAARAPASRYPSAAAFAADLRRWLAGEPVLAAPPSPWQRMVRWAARHPVIMTGAACAGVLAAAVAIAEVGARRFYREPVRVVVNDETGEVVLQSRMGTPIRSWRPDPQLGGATMAAIVRTAPAFGGERLLLLAVAGGSGFGTAPASLCAFRLKDVVATDDLPTPLWASGDRAPAIECPPEVRQPGDRFNTVKILVTDVFTGPDHPGDEVVAAHVHEHGGLTAFRVYAAHSGAMLYETWHWGSMQSMFMSRDAQGPILFVAGLSNPHSPLARTKIGGKIKYATTAFAVRPEPGARVGFVNLRADEPARPPPDVLWYRFIAVDDGNGLLADWDLLPVLQLPSEARPPAGPGSVNLVLDLAPVSAMSQRMNSGISVVLKVNPDGRIVDRMPSDAYRLDLEHEIPAGAWRLDADPPKPTALYYKPGAKRWP